MSQSHDAKKMLDAREKRGKTSVIASTSDWPRLRCASEFCLAQPQSNNMEIPTHVIIKHKITYFVHSLVGFWYPPMLPSYILFTLTLPKDSMYWWDRNNKAMNTTLRYLVTRLVVVPHQHLQQHTLTVCSSHLSKVRDLTLDTCTPRLRWIPEHSMQTRIPRLMLAQSGPTRKK